MFSLLPATWDTECPRQPPISGSQGNTRRTQLLLLIISFSVQGVAVARVLLPGHYWASSPSLNQIAVAPGSRAIRFKSLTVRWAPRTCFVPRCAFLSPILISAVIASLRFLFIVCSPLYTVVESGATCHFLQQFFRAFVAGSRFPSLSECCAHPSSLMAVFYGHPHPSGGPHLSLTLPGASWISA